MSWTLSVSRIALSIPMCAFFAAYQFQDKLSHPVNGDSRKPRELSTNWLRKQPGLYTAFPMLR